MADVTVIGAGIAGCAAAAFLAEAGAQVRVHELTGIAAGASGRNSGVLQHPMDPALVGLYEESRALHGFEGPPGGLLTVSADADALAAAGATLGAAFPELAPELFEDGREVEPLLAPGIAALRLATGDPVPPGEATRRFADRARRAGARFEIGPGELGSGITLVAAGPWTGRLLPETGISFLWGVVAEVELADEPRHPIEELGADTLLGEPPPALFSIVRTALGSTFASERPDPAALVGAIVERGARYVPALSEARVRSTRTCARPHSPDARPFIGPVPGRDGVHVCAGHGPWGISLGPASARLAADAILTGAPVPPELSAARLAE